MKILSFAATNGRQSINKHFVSYASQVLSEQQGVENTEVELLDLNDFEMPIYSLDRENESGIPAQAHRFFNKIREADVILISFAEHNGNYTVAYKNLYDWTSRINQKVFDGKSVVALSTSPGPGGAQSVLRIAVESLPYAGAELVGSYSLSSFYENFDVEAGRLVNAEHEAELSAIFDGLLSIRISAA